MKYGRVDTSGALRSSLWFRFSYPLQWVSGGDELGIKEDEDLSPEEDANYYDEEFKKSLSSNEAMEKLVKKSIEVSNKFYEEQMRVMNKETRESSADGDELVMRGKRAKASREEWKLLGYGPFRNKVKKSKIPLSVFLRAAVMPFTYMNLVKEIVLTRHAIVKGEIGRKK